MTSPFPKEKTAFIFVFFKSVILKVNVEECQMKHDRCGQHYIRCDTGYRKFE